MYTFSVQIVMLSAVMKVCEILPQIYQHPNPIPRTERGAIIPRTVSLARPSSPQVGTNHHEHPTKSSIKTKNRSYLRPTNNPSAERASRVERSGRDRRPSTRITRLGCGPRSALLALSAAINSGAPHAPLLHISKRKRDDPLSDDATKKVCVMRLRRWRTAVERRVRIGWEGQNHLPQMSRGERCGGFAPCCSLTITFLHVLLRGISILSATYARRLQSE